MRNGRAIECECKTKLTVMFTVFAWHERAGLMCKRINCSKYAKNQFFHQANRNSECIDVIVLDVYEANKEKCNGTEKFSRRSTRICY